MSDVEGVGKIEKAANNALLMLVARWTMVLMAPFLTAAAVLAGYAGDRVITTIDKAAHDIGDMRVKLTSIEGANFLLSSHQALQDTVNDARFQNVTGRINKLDLDIDDLKKRVYPLTGPLAGPR